jgi:hypothetical protein
MSISPNLLKWQSQIVVRLREPLEFHDGIRPRHSTPPAKLEDDFDLLSHVRTDNLGEIVVASHARHPKLTVRAITALCFEADGKARSVEYLSRLSQLAK